MEDTVPEMSTHYRKFQRQWQWLSTWNQVTRPWWEEQYQKWSLSPWSVVSAREWIAQFREAHIRRELPECTMLVWKMINAIGEDKYSKGFDPLLGPTMNLWASIASLMMASIPVMPGAYDRKGPRPDIWWYPNSFVKQDEHKPGPWTYPSDGLINFWARFCPMGVTYAVPHSWLLACYNTFQKLWVHHHTTKTQGQWADFDFQIPEYDDNWAMITDGSEVNVNYYNLPVCNWMSHHAPTGTEAAFYVPSPPASPESNITGVRVSQDGSSTVARRTRASARGRRKPLYPLHFSTGEVGNNMNDDDFWVIETDGDGGYDIFSISSMLIS
ncbi:uncharacterized protein PG986_004937 [Apiospora aurea]|uniref:Uncharacterized protein n=1 Tax=Apiospora aurea TaxID=335848 RepID=A0ABR1QG56_9PEZI